MACLEPRWLFGRLDLNDPDLDLAGDPAAEVVLLKEFVLDLTGDPTVSVLLKEPVLDLEGDPPEMVLLKESVLGLEGEPTLKFLLTQLP